MPRQTQHQRIPRPLRWPSSRGPATSRFTNTPPPVSAVFLHGSFSKRNKQKDAACALPLDLGQEPHHPRPLHCYAHSLSDLTTKRHKEVYLNVCLQM